jgi:delta(3,5)-delta(2,4)-dienoyl-CoA isomerase
MSSTNAPRPQFFNITFPAEYVAHVEINRPQKLNAFVDPMWPEMKAVFEWLSSNPDVRCVLFSGAGDRAFTTGEFSSAGPSSPPNAPLLSLEFFLSFFNTGRAGLDVQAAAQHGPILAPAIDASRKAFALRSHILDWQRCVSAISSCQKPVIALMHGYVYGAGVDLSTACDIRFCAANAVFCIKETDIGLAADIGTLARLPKVLGGLTSFAKEAALSARPFSADEALKHGFVSRVLSNKDELVAEGLKVAQLVASKSPVAVQGTKNILDAAWGRTVEDNLNYTAIWNAGMLQSTDTERAMTSGLQRRTPTFEKL